VWASGPEKQNTEPDLEKKTEKKSIDQKSQQSGPKTDQTSFGFLPHRTDFFINLILYF